MDHVRDYRRRGVRRRHREYNNTSRLRLELFQLQSHEGKDVLQNRRAVRDRDGLLLQLLGSAAEGGIMRVERNKLHVRLHDVLARLRDEER